MRIKHISKILLFTFLILVTISCLSDKQAKITTKIIGTYVFQFPSKEIEILTINKDSTYGQKIYLNSENFKKNIKPLYVNRGKWSSSKYELEFFNWLAYCHLRYPDSILNKPEHGLMMNVYWEKPSKTHNGYISIFHESGYIFSNIKDWDWESKKDD